MPSLDLRPRSDAKPRRLPGPRLSRRSARRLVSFSVLVRRRGGDATQGPMRLRVDPWDPEYGASVELEPDLEEPVGLDLDVERPAPWAAIPPGVSDRLPCCAFVDGVRRIDARLFAEDDGVDAPGLAGSWAVGCAWSTRPPRVDDVAVGRELIVGCDLKASPPELPIGEN